MEKIPTQLFSTSLGNEFIITLLQDENVINIYIFLFSPDPAVTALFGHSQLSKGWL